MKRTGWRPPLIAGTLSTIGFVMTVLPENHFAIIASVLEAVEEYYEETADLTLYRWGEAEVRVATVQSRVDPTIALLFTVASSLRHTTLVSPTDPDPKKV